MQRGVLILTLYGSQPYNEKLKASDNLLVSTITMGEGWHNYHHSFQKIIELQK